MIVNARPRARMLSAVVAALAVLALPTSGCDMLSAFRGEEEADTTVEELSGSIGPCLSWFDRGVVDVAMSGDGSRVAYIASRRPESLPEDAWRSGDRAVFVRDRTEQGATSTRYIASTWAPLDEIPAYSTEDPQRDGKDDAIPLAEQLQELALSDDGSRIVVGVSREGIEGGLAKLYAGSIPEDTTSTLRPPDGGLTVVPINTIQSAEAVNRFELSPDGSKVAAALGPRGELRIYDLNANVPIVYNLGDDNAVTISNELPPISTSILVERRAAILTGGSALHWSPDGTRIAFSRTVPVTTSYIQIVDVATGEVTTVRRIVGVTAPQLAWATDSASLFVLTTRLAESEAFGNSEVRRLAAEEDGEQLGSAMSMTREPHWRSEPNGLASLGNDRQFVVSLDGRIFRLDFPSDEAQAPRKLEFGALPSGTNIPAQRVLTSADADIAVFTVVTGGVVRVGQRAYVSQNECPEAPTREAQPTGAAGEEAADEEAPSPTAEG